MKIVSSSTSLDLSGVPTFTLTMYRELIKRGHEVTVYSPEGGKLETEMNAIKNIGEIPLPDAIIAQGNLCAELLKKTFPDVPIIFYSHGILPELERPPRFAADWYLAINEEVQKNLRDKGVPDKKISIVRDFIDTDRFISTKPLHEKIKQVLFISNYKKWKNFQTVEAACNQLGVKLVCFGSPYGRNYKIEDAINEADLVISWGRGILEAMSCGRAALSFDRFEGDGYITQETYFEARKDNFSGRHYKYAYKGDTLADEMLKYGAGCAKVNRDLVMKYHNVVNGVDQILEIIKKI
jgi:glycosyltransferase involved in cell wall biosynthesis